MESGSGVADATATSTTSAHATSAPMMRGSSKKAPEKNASAVGRTIRAVAPAARTQLRIGGPG